MHALDVERPAAGGQLAAEAPEQVVIAPAAAERRAERGVVDLEDGAFGAPIGGGGRYDDLLGRFGRELPACGWALDVERVHLARLEEGR